MSKREQIIFQMAKAMDGVPIEEADWSILAAAAFDAALVEMEKPSEEMVEAGANAPLNSDHDVGYPAALRVIRAALQPLKGGGQ